MMAVVKRRRVEDNLMCPITASIQVYQGTTLFARKKKRTLKMVAGACYIPKESKSKPKGEDAHFICKKKQTIGVADGVGGWARRGVDAGEYARQLMENSVVALYSQPVGEPISPLKVLEEAHLRTQVDGSSTACIVTLEGEKLKYVNIGDSGFMLFRDKELVYRSLAQQYSFNRPYQIRKDNNDLKELALEAEVRVKAGDVMVVGTDGLFDNMFTAEIEEILQVIQGDYFPEKLAWSLATIASINSTDEGYTSPFEIGASANGKLWSGGKYDDITVVVVQIESA